jgi:hypothetical protein
MRFLHPSYKLTLFALLSGISCLVCTISKAQNKRFFTGDNTDENEFNKISKSAQRATRDMENLPTAVSLKQYAPIPGDQGKHGTCVAWSTAYAARTISYCIQHQITDQEKIKPVIFSPNYLYYYIKIPGDTNCTLGAKIEPALKVLSDKGDPLLSENIADCIGAINAVTDNKAHDFIIKAYTSLTNTFGRISKNEVIAIKKSLSEKKPVIFSLKCMSSLFRTGKDGIWNIDQNDESVGNHAICIVGYDDNKLGGSFEVINSWGTAWGNNGFFWITYDQIMQYGSYALELMDREVYDGSGNRDLGPPQIKGSLDFILADDFGNDIKAMPVLRTLKTDNNAGFSGYRLVENYAAGQKFKIKFTTNAPAFVYIFSIDNKQVVSSLFPYADNISPAINSTDATIYLPSGDKHYKLDADASRDNICVLYSKTAINFEDLKNKILKAPSNVYETINTLYKNRLIPFKNVSFRDDRIGFSSLAAEQELLCFFIDMNHK